MDSSSKPDGKPEESDPFINWLGDETRAISKFMQERGMTQAQAAYVVTVVLSAWMGETGTGEKTNIPLIAIGHALRQQAIQHWKQAQIVN